MEFKGTKGKWVADGTDVLIDDYSSAIQLKHVCEACPKNHYNALLISKSPEMLEMLQYLNRRGGLGLDIHNKIEQLIKQATEL